MSLRAGLARNVAFISALMEAGVEFEAVDLPQANRLTVHIMAAMAEHLSLIHISEPTRQAEISYAVFLTGRIGPPDAKVA